MFYVYVLQSVSYPLQLYFGSTNDLRKRLSKHNSLKNFSTKRYAPWRLIYYEAFVSEKDARLREQKLKHHGKGKQELMKRLVNSLKQKGAG